MKNVKTSKLEIEFVSKHIASWMKSVDCCMLTLNNKKLEVGLSASS